MQWRLLPTVFVGTALLATFNLGSTKTLSQETPASKITFVCASEVNPPITYAYTPGEVNLKPLMIWHSEYLLPNESAAELCQRVAQKLQTSYNQQQDYLLASDGTDKMWKVCLVSKSGDGCDVSNSVYLFSLNGNYAQAPKCLMEGIDPLQCPRSRGKVISLPGGRYTPFWWPF
jgi:Circadian oscillating protein COP23